MAEQDKAATDKVANADLEKKADEILEKKEELKDAKDELKEVKEKLDSDDIDQAEKSRLGRKVKRLEDVVLEIRDTLATLANNKSVSGIPKHEEESGSIYVSTDKDVEQVIEMRDRRKQEEQIKYERAYLSHIDKIADDELHEDIMKEMMEHFNKRHSNDASLDAELNYEKARSSLLRRKIVKPKANLKGDKPGSNANVGVTSKSDESGAVEISLDEHASSLIKHYGMKPEKVKEALKGSFPAHLRGR